MVNMDAGDIYFFPQPGAVYPARRVAGRVPADERRDIRILRLVAVAACVDEDTNVVTP